MLNRLIDAVVGVGVGVTELNLVHSPADCRTGFSEVRSIRHDRLVDIGAAGETFTPME